MCLTYKRASRIFIRLLDEVESRGQRLTVPASGNWSANASRAQGLNARKACRVRHFFMTKIPVMDIDFCYKVKVVLPLHAYSQS